VRDSGIPSCRGNVAPLWLADVTPLSSADAVLLSIVFAARDEAEKLPAALTTLLAQDYPNYEVIAVNDRSQDETPAILHQFERISQNLKVTNIDQLPPGWLGKPHALVAGFEKSHGGVVWCDMFYPIAELRKGLE
jgi:glycosyltransferase involved in cell wall biosynthesis